MGFFNFFKRNSKDDIPVADIPIALLNVFTKYKVQIASELSRAKISSETLDAEVSVFLYWIVKAVARASSVNQTTASHLIYEHAIKNITESAIIRHMGVVTREHIYTTVFLEPNKAQGVWMLSHQSYSNPFNACWVAFGDVLTHPHCAEHIDDYEKSSYPVKIFGFDLSMDFQMIFMNSVETYAEYVKEICRLIEKMK